MEQYYINQAGYGQLFYRGVRYQRGHGFFGRLISGTVLPLLRYLGKKALGTATHVATDYLSGENIKKSIKRRGKETASNVLEDLSNKIQKGEGIKRGRKRKLKVKECITPIKKPKVNKKKRVNKKCRVKLEFLK